MHRTNFALDDKDQAGLHSPTRLFSTNENLSFNPSNQSPTCSFSTCIVKMAYTKKRRHSPVPFVREGIRSSNDYNERNYFDNSAPQHKQANPRPNSYAEHGFRKAEPNAYIGCEKINVAVGSIIKFDPKNTLDQRQFKCVHTQCRDPTPHGKDFFKHPLVVLRIWYENDQPCALVSLRDAWQGGKNPMPLFRTIDACERAGIYVDNDLANTIYLEYPGGSFDHSSWFQYNHAYKVKLASCIPFNPHLWLNRLEKTSYLTLMEKLHLQPAKWVSTETIKEGSRAYVPGKYDEEWDNSSFPANIEIQDTSDVSRKVSPTSSNSLTYNGSASTMSTPPSSPQQQNGAETIRNGQNMLPQLQQRLRNIQISGEQARTTTNPTIRSWANAAAAPKKDKFLPLPPASSRPQNSGFAKSKRGRQRGEKLDSYRPAARGCDPDYDRSYNQTTWYKD
ncbi:hypothetical protein BDZ45DRAFT_745644 [Acephala macrosclerotiorum]|nr:hypothetical protein BDZ45DRAFT_745644 [Acephala macrosclerotiorum]